MGFIICFFVWAVAWPPLRAALASVWHWIVVTSVSVLISYAIRWFLLDRYAGHPSRGITKSRCWRLVDLVVSVTSLLSGPISALERLLMSLLATLLLLPRADTPIAPSQLRSFDWLYGYYIETLRLQHYVDVARELGEDQYL